jgi:hypothetical protein
MSKQTCTAHEQAQRKRQSKGNGTVGSRPKFELTSDPDTARTAKRVCCIL